MINSRALKNISIDTITRMDYSTVSICSNASDSMKQLIMKIHPIINERIFQVLFNGKVVSISNDLEEAMSEYNKL